MAETKQMEIPQKMRELAMHNLDQARAACVQLMDTARKAQDMMKTIIPLHPVAQGLVVMPGWRPSSPGAWQFGERGFAEGKAGGS